MIYSDYQMDQIASPIYEQICAKLLSLTKDEEIRIKMERYII